MLASSLQTLFSLAGSGTPPARLHALADGAFNAGVNVNSIFASKRSVTNHLYALEQSILKYSGVYGRDDEDPDAEEYVTPDMQRKRALAMNDPIASFTPKSVLESSLKLMSTSLSAEVLQAIFAGVDPDILQQVSAIARQP
jgi:hypothetical protein